MYSEANMYHLKMKTSYRSCVGGNGSACVIMCVEPENNIRNTIHLFWRESFSLAWNSPIRLDEGCPASFMNPPVTPSLFLGLQVCVSRLDFLYLGFWVTLMSLSLQNTDSAVSPTHYSQWDFCCLWAFLLLLVPPPPPLVRTEDRLE